MHNKFWEKNCIVKFAKLLLYNIFPFSSCVFKYFWINLFFLYFLADNWNFCLLKLSLYFDNACRVALCILIVVEQRWIWFWILCQSILQLMHQSSGFVTRKISLVSNTNHLSPPYISQRLAIFCKGISLPLSLWDIYTHGCRMHVDGVSLRVNKKLKYSLISQRKCINMCATIAFHELLKVHSVRTHISISKYYLQDFFF